MYSNINNGKVILGAEVKGLGKIIKYHGLILIKNRFRIPELGSMEHYKPKQGSDNDTRLQHISRKNPNTKDHINAFISDGTDLYKVTRLIEDIRDFYQSLGYEIGNFGTIE